MRSRNVRSDVSARCGTRRSSIALFSFVHRELGAGTAMPLASRRGGASSADRRSTASSHAFAVAARRHVDHPSQAHVVVRIDQQLQVGERILDFLALVKAHAADDPVRKARAHQRIFDDARLRVRAIQHRHRAVGCARDARVRCAHDEVGFFELVRSAEILDEVAALALGPQPLFFPILVLADHRRCGIENDLRRSVVPLELDDPGLGKVVLEVEDVSQVGAAPAINRLIGVADHRQVAMPLGEPLNEVILRPVRVLIFVDHHEAELFGIFLAYVRDLVEQLDGLQQEIVEIERTVVFEALRVLFVHFGELLAALAPALRPEEVRPGHRVLRVADLGQRHPRLHDAVVDLELFEHLLDQRDLIGRVVDHEIARQADGGRFAPQESCAQRVKRRNPRADERRAEQRLDARTHFFRSLVGERDGEYLVVLRVSLGQEICDALGDDARLARARACEDQQRAVDVQDGVALFGIQRCKCIHGFRWRYRGVRA